MSYYVDFTKFSWEAFATLITGLSAVAGAVVVGWRQLNISERQIAIASRQVRVDELALRASLFERRLAVYRATERYLKQATKLRIDDFPDVEVWQTFADQMELARFLFSASVRKRLDQIASEADELIVAREDVRAARERGQEGNSEYAGSVNRLLKQLRINVQTLADVLGEEMNLYVPPDDSPPTNSTRRVASRPETSQSEGAK